MLRPGKNSINPGKKKKLNKSARATREGGLATAPINKVGRMKYTITFSCGHEDVIELFGKNEDRGKKIKFAQEYYVCSECYRAQKNSEAAEGCDAIEMLYKDYKANYPDCKTKIGSYNNEKKSIIVYVPKKEEDEMEKFTHYGIEVVYQLLDTYKGNNFRQTLKENGVEWTDLPVLEPDVLTYTKDGVRRYACIKERQEFTEVVYITESIPLDMDWGKLIDDCDQQNNGEAPMEMETKARIICRKAEEMALEYVIENNKKENPFFMPRITPEELKRAFIALGYSREDILDMDHHDVADDFLDMLK